MTVGAIVQARMGSTRLPGKVLKPLVGKPLILLIMNRVMQAKRVDKVILATGDSPDNKPLISLAEGSGFASFAGSEQDVLDRYRQCAKKYGLDIIVRITGDCPFIDPEVIDLVVELFFEKGADYASNVNPPTYPDGLDVEVFSADALETAWNDAVLPSDREHVTPFIWKNPGKFKLVNLCNDEDLSGWRLTVDEPEDWIRIEQLARIVDIGKCRLKDIMEVLRGNESLIELDKSKRNLGYRKSLEGDRNEN